MQFNETEQEARSQRPPSRFCISGRSKKQDGRLGLWFAETFSTSLKPLNGILRNLTGRNILMSSTKFVFLGRSKKKTRWPHWPLIGSDIFDFSPWKRWTEFYGTCQEARSQCPLPSLCFGADQKNKMAARPLIGWYIFNFSSETDERNSTKLDKKQDLNVLYQVCVFFGPIGKQDGRSGLWLAETFSTSPLKPQNGIQRNLIGSKISRSYIKFMFFGPIGKTRWPPRPLIGWYIFDFSSETDERNLTKLNRKQDIKVPYQVCVFMADRKNKMAALASDWLRHFGLLWNCWTEFNELDRIQDFNGLYQICVFRADRKNKMAARLLICRDIFYFSSEIAERNSTKPDRKQDLNFLYLVCVLQVDN